MQVSTYSDVCVKFSKNKMKYLKKKEIRKVCQKK